MKRHYISTFITCCFLLGLGFFVSCSNAQVDEYVTSHDGGIAVTDSGTKMGDTSTFDSGSRDVAQSPDRISSTPELNYKVPEGHEQNYMKSPRVEVPDFPPSKNAVLIVYDKGTVVPPNRRHEQPLRLLEKLPLGSDRKPYEYILYADTPKLVEPGEYYLRGAHYLGYLTALDLPGGDHFTVKIGKDHPKEIKSHTLLYNTIPRIFKRGYYSYNGDLKKRPSYDGNVVDVTTYFKDGIEFFIIKDLCEIPSIGYYRMEVVQVGSKRDPEMFFYASGSLYKKEYKRKTDYDGTFTAREHLPDERRRWIRVELWVEHPSRKREKRKGYICTLIPR